MFLFSPFTSILWIYFMAAVIPAVWLMSYIYKQDRIEKEPADLLWKCAGCGVLAALVSGVLEMIAESLLDMSPIDQNTVTGVMILAFLIVGVIEEGTKYLFMGKLTWHKPDFNCRFDGIVYAAFTSLGFAAFENISYVFQYGLTTAFTRAFLSIPGHLGFAVLFGCFYGRAKKASDQGKNGKAVLEIIIGYILAVSLHGIYDTCAMLGTGKAAALFVVVVAVIYIIVYFLVRHESNTDEYI